MQPSSTPRSSSIANLNMMGRKTNIEQSPIDLNVGRIQMFKIGPRPFDYNDRDPIFHISKAPAGD